MKAIFLVAAAGLVALACADIDFNIPLPGGSANITLNFDGLKNFVDQQLEKIGLDEEARQVLTEELKQLWEDRPQPPSGWSMMNPLAWVKYNIDLSAYATKIAAQIVKKGIQMVQDGMSGINVGTRQQPMAVH